ncbi:unnamed protein product [Arctia plantaginis]|uniref:BESS domain-containing protein n=1 Tax=Arctia plantaginis TaxID=874455 RepID=A0A8S1B496_ARCPL|nr:unnamed protein product [Arctia plantaginis]
MHRSMNTALIRSAACRVEFALYGSECVVCTAPNTSIVVKEALRSSSNSEIELKQDTVTTSDRQAEHMSFEATLDPHIDHGITLDPIKNTHTDIIINETTNLQTNSVTPSSSSHQSIRTPSIRTGNRKKRQHDSVFSTLHRLDNIVSNIVSTTQEQNVQIQREDEFHMFALSVAAQLRQLPLHVAIATQSKIQSILSEFRITYIFSNTSSPPSVTVKKEDEN